MTSGFYRLFEGYLQHAPNFVYAPEGFRMERKDRNRYTYPKGGWIWCETLEEAEKVIGATMPPKAENDTGGDLA